MIRSGEILDMAVEAGIVDKSGSWFAYGNEKLGQGRERVCALLDQNLLLRDEIEAKVKEHLGLGEDLAQAVADREGGADFPENAGAPEAAGRDEAGDPLFDDDNFDDDNF